jgi:hypothetical protein
MIDMVQSVQIPSYQIGQFKMPYFNQNGSSWNDSDIGEASQWNSNKSFQTIEDIKIDANFAWLIFSLLIAMIWFTYITHYSARVIGQILTHLLNRFVIGSGYLRIGKYFWNPSFTVMLTRIYFPLRFTHLGCISWKNYVS